MRVSNLSVTYPVLASALNFHADNSTLTGGGSNSMPMAYDLAESQTNVINGGSYWLSAFVHASNDRDYMIISHASYNIPGVTAFQSLYGASMIDIRDPSQYKQFTTLVNNTVFNTAGVFDADFGDWGMGSTSNTNAASQMQSFSNVPGAEFNLTYDLSSPVLLNGGLGFFDCAGELGLQWSMPAGRTTGTITVNGTELTVDPQRSFTWYDRQWGAVPGVWTWFQLHLDNDIIMSVWDWAGTICPGKKFATVRKGYGKAGQTIVPITSLRSSNRTFTSLASNITYPLDWTLELEDGTKLDISSIRDDQELHADGGLIPLYEGFATVRGVYQGKHSVKGYGIAEMAS